ncbi:hypothetical protein E2C01_021302 [Portunus trituberculatus]|uniref:Uncharacterized protein n=1 Tax=Portunus trituberculatus TaxID=210409 RepID=A0A5B7E2X3_PORTR|nr:hypothetical protein [Portunus trituberculatus]
MEIDPVGFSREFMGYLLSQNPPIRKPLPQMRGVTYSVAFSCCSASSSFCSTSIASLDAWYLSSVTVSSSCVIRLLSLLGVPRNIRGVFGRRLERPSKASEKGVVWWRGSRSVGRTMGICRAEEEEREGRRRRKSIKSTPVVVVLLVGVLVLVRRWLYSLRAAWSCCSQYMRPWTDEASKTISWFPHLKKTSHTS